MIAHYQTPPIETNHLGLPRRVGVELEFAGLDLFAVGQEVCGLFGGEHDRSDRFAQQVRDTSLGDFKLELDATVLKDRTYLDALRQAGIDVPADGWGDSLDALLGKLAETIIPYEVTTPPLPLEKLPEMDRLREALRQAGARGTNRSPLYAFGLHLNPDAISLAANDLLAVLRAMLLISSWLRRESRLDWTRLLTPFIDDYPEAYYRLVLDADYRPEIDELIDDYLAHNPTRDRALDALPIFAEIDEPRVLAAAEHPHLVQARAAWHYRLPNSRVSDPDWRIAGEWNRWVAVERLSADRDRLAEMTDAWRRRKQTLLGDLFGSWAKEAGSWL